MAWFWRKKSEKTPPGPHRAKEKPNTRVSGMESLEDRTVLDTRLTLGAGVDDFLRAERAANGKLDANLASLSVKYEASPGTFDISSVPNSEFYFITPDGRVNVTVQGTSNGSQLLADVSALGMKQTKISGNRATGWVDISRIDDFAGMETIQRVQWNYRPMIHTGSVTSEADTVMRANIARGLYGIDGTGVTIGIISDSFDSLIIDSYALDVFTGDLPSDVVILSDSVGTDEGRAMAQLVHDLAPGAKIVFHTAGSSQDDMAGAIDALANYGCDIIVDDVIFFEEPMFQDGVIAQAVDRAVKNGVAYFSAAGNDSNQSWEDTFRSSGVFLENLLVDDSDFLVLGGGELHDFNPGPEVDIFQSVIGASRVVLQWDNSSLSATDGLVGPTHDYDIFVIDEEGAIILDPDLLTYGIDTNSLTGEPTEFFFVPPEAVAIFIVNRTGATNFLKTVWFDNLLVFDYGLDTVGKPTVYGHANAEGAVAVAAAYYETPTVPEDFTSLGGTPMFFDIDGNRTFTNYRRAPSVTGTDGVNNTFFGSDRDGNGFPNFSGTSAAAPHVAAVAALMLQASPSATPRALRIALEQSALDIFTPGYDFVTGHGLVQADAAIETLLNMRSVLLVDVSDSMVAFNSLDVNGDGQLTDLDDLDGDGTKGTALDQAISVIRQLDSEGYFLPNISIIVFGKDARFVDMSPAAGIQNTIPYVEGLTPNLSSFRVGSGGQYTTSYVNSSRSFYDQPLNGVLSSRTVGEYTEAVLVTDGSGLIPSNNILINALASQNVTVNSFVVGHYHEVGSISSVQRLADGTGGRIAIDLTPVIIENTIQRPTTIYASLPTNNNALNVFENLIRNGFGPLAIPIAQFAPLRSTGVPNTLGGPISTTFSFARQSDEEEESTNSSLDAPSSGSGSAGLSADDVVVELDDPILVDETPDASTDESTEGTSEGDETVANEDIIDDVLAA